MNKFYSPQLSHKSINCQNLLKINQKYAITFSPKTSQIGNSMGMFLGERFPRRANGAQPLPHMIPKGLGCPRPAVG